VQIHGSVESDVFMVVNISKNVLALSI